jgi:glycosyltransferase involved in cell wall biosynthesis
MTNQRELPTINIHDIRSQETSDPNALSSTPLVSVAMLTYNHESYIAQAIEGVLAQKTDFPIELIIGEDCSTDLTCQIVREYQEKHAGIVRVITSSHNVGAKKNCLRILGVCRGKYIAMCEGDDYWIDPYKLQKQVDFLEANEDYVLVGHNAVKVLEEEGFGTFHMMRGDKPDHDFDTRSLMCHNPLATLAAMWRNGLVTSFPEIWMIGPGGDRHLWLLLSQYGRCRFINDVVGVYRAHSGGIIAQTTGSPEKIIDGCLSDIARTKEWDAFLNFKYHEDAVFDIHRKSLEIVVESVKTLRLKLSLQYVSSVDPQKVAGGKRKLLISLLRAIKPLVCADKKIR